MTKSLLLTLIWIFVSVQLFAQNPSTTFAPWKNNAKGAYSLIHDDFGDPIASGIENYADTIASNRGVKFTFGAITGSCDAADWANANRMISHGHEVMNHTHNHYCAMDPGWCSTQIWADFATELDQSTTLIQTNTSVYPRFFIWPFDITTQASKNYLRDNLHYYGARGGIQNQSLNTNQLNNAVITDFMSLNFSVYAPTTSATELNGLIDMAIANGKWGIRETHGVNDGSWASVTLADYRAHMNYIRSKVQSGDLWNATATEVTTYKMQAQNFIPTTTYSAANQEIRINWNSPDIDLTDLRSDVTLNVNLDGLTGYIYIYQANTQITSYSTVSGVLRFNAYPHKGEIIIRKTPWTIFPPGPFTISSTSACTNQSGIVYEVPPIAGATFIWAYSGSGVTINNATTNHVTLDFGPGATSGVLSVKSVTTAGTSPDATVSITVNAGYQTQGATRCGPGSVTLQVLTAGQYEWFDAATAGTLLSSANTYQPTVSASTTYYTQRKATVNNYSLGKASQGSTNLTTIWWFPSWAQKMTLQKKMVLSTLKVWGTGITGATIAVVDVNSGAIIAQSAAFNCNANGTVVNVNIPLNPGTYFLFVNSPNGQGAYESNVTTTYTIAGVGTIENRVYGISVNASNIVTQTNVLGNAFGPCYDLKFTETIPDVCPRNQVQAIVNNVPAQPAAFTQSSTDVCRNQSGVLYSVPSVAGVTYAWAYTGTGFTLNGSGANLSVNTSGTATSGTLSVTPSNSCGSGTARTMNVNVSTAAATPGAITGNTAVCAGTSNVVYNVTPVAGVTYNWSYTGTQAALTPSGASLSVNYLAGATSGSITVTATNSCGTSVATTLAVTVNATPAQPAAYTASVVAPCKGSSGNVYTVPSVAGVTYTWTYTGTGATITGSGNSVSIAYSAAATNGDVQVTAGNSCGTSVARSVTISLNDIPAQPAAFTASVASPCKGSSGNVYTVPSVAGVTYTWSYTGTGATITGSGNSVTVVYSVSATNGNMQVTAGNACGISSVRTVAVSLNNIPAQPGAFTASVTSACIGSSGNIYTVPLVAGVTYSWSYTGTGATITGSGNSVSIAFSSNATDGMVQVSATNVCGTSSVRATAVTLNTVSPQPPNFVTSVISPCKGSSGNVYALPMIAGVTYAWSYTGTGATINGSGNSISIDYSASATDGVLQVSTSNTCGMSPIRSLTISLKTTPSTAGSISGIASICLGQDYAYSVSSIAGVTYTWNYSGSGATLTPSGASAVLNGTPSFVSGTLSVIPSNECGTGTSSILVIQTVPVPHQPVSFTHSQSIVTQGNTAIWFETQSYPGETYMWTYTGTGATFNGSSLSALQYVDFSNSATSGDIKVRSVNSCGVQSQDLTQAITVLPVVTSTQNSSEVLGVYPNPTAEYVSIDIPTAMNQGVLNVCNIEGVMVQSIKLQGQLLLNLSLGDLPAGVYVVSITSENEVYRTKLIKQ